MGPRRQDSRQRKAGKRGSPITNTSRERSIAKSIQRQCPEGAWSRSTRPDRRKENEGCIRRPHCAFATGGRGRGHCIQLQPVFLSRNRPGEFPSTFLLSPPVDYEF